MGVQCWQEARAGNPDWVLIRAVGQVTSKGELTRGSCRNADEQSQDAVMWGILGQGRGRQSPELQSADARSGNAVSWN